MPHIVTGDLNAAGWQTLREEWLQSAALNALIDPVLPTYASGSSISKIQSSPGRYVPSIFLPRGNLQGNGLSTA